MPARLTAVLATQMEVIIVSADQYRCIRREEEKGCEEETLQIKNPQAFHSAKREFERSLLSGGIS